MPKKVFSGPAPSTSAASSISIGIDFTNPWLKTEGVAVVLATSSVRERAVEVLTRLGVVQYFDDMVFGKSLTGAELACSA